MSCGLIGELPSQGQAIHTPRDSALGEFRFAFLGLTAILGRIIGQVPIGICLALPHREYDCQSPGLLFLPYLRRSTAFRSLREHTRKRLTRKVDEIARHRWPGQAEHAVGAADFSVRAIRQVRESEGTPHK